MILSYDPSYPRSAATSAARHAARSPDSARSRGRRPVGAAAAHRGGVPAPADAAWRAGAGGLGALRHVPRRPRRAAGGRAGDRAVVVAGDLPALLPRDGDRALPAGARGGLRAMVGLCADPP